jgi:hypothetical protein
MLHLLTEEHRKKVVVEYKKRVVIVLLLGLLCVSAISAVFILPTFFLSYGKYSIVLSQQKTLDSEIAIKEESGSSESIKNVTLSIEALKTFEGSKDASVVLENIVEARPDGVQIKNFVFTPGSGSELTVDIAGRADTRKSLVKLNQNLKSNALFDDVSIPLSSFAKDRDITFSAKIIVSTSTMPVADAMSAEVPGQPIAPAAASSTSSASSTGTSTTSTASFATSSISKKTAATSSTASKTNEK